LQGRAITLHTDHQRQSGGPHPEQSNGGFFRVDPGTRGNLGHRRPAELGHG